MLEIVIATAVTISVGIKQLTGATMSCF